MTTTSTTFKFSKPVSYLKIQEQSKEVFRFGVYLMIRDLQMLGFTPALPNTTDYSLRLTLPEKNFNQTILNRLEKYVADNSSDLSKLKPERLSKLVLAYTENFSMSMITPLTGVSKHMLVHLKTNDLVQIRKVASSPITHASTEPTEIAE